MQYMLMIDTLLTAVLSCIEAVFINFFISGWYYVFLVNTLILIVFNCIKGT